MKTDKKTGKPRGRPVNTFKSSVRNLVPEELDLVPD